MGMSTGASSGGSMPPMSEINVTPLVDVMLVLLIIFMVTTPHLEKGLKVDLPQVQMATDLKKNPEELVIKITKDNKVYIDDTEVALDKRLAPVIKETLTKRPSENVYIRADKNVPYGVVVKVMAAARQAGIKGVGLVTEEEEFN